MEKIKNGDGKTVCAVDATTKVVEIVKNGCKTIITFLPNATYKIKNLKVK